MAFTDRIKSILRKANPKPVRRPTPPPPRPTPNGPQQPSV